MFTNLPINCIKLLDQDFSPRREKVRSYLHKFDENRLMHAFLLNAGFASQASPLGGWEAPGCGLRGHFTGHFLSACAKFAFSDRDILLKHKAERVVSILARCAKPNGYLSAFEETVLDTLEEEEDRNVWAPYYTLHKILQGLTDCAVLLENQEAMALALNLADYIAGRFHRLSGWKTDGILRCTRLNPVNEFGGMGDTLYTLYELTKKEWLLELAELFDRDYFTGNLSRGQDILEDLHANTHLPMILSAMHRYEITDEPAYRQAAEAFYHALSGRTFANGNSSSKASAFKRGGVSEKAEHWGVFGHLEDALTGGESESCCAHNTEKIVEKFFKWTGNTTYLAHMESLKYNAVLNSASAKSGLSQYHQPMGNGAVKKFSEPLDSFWCCTGSGIEAMSELQKNIWLAEQNSLLIQAYISSEVYWPEMELKITQRSFYPDKPLSLLTVETTVPVTCNLVFRENTVNEIKVNGTSFEGKREKGFLILHRTFQDQDMIEIAIYSSLHMVRLPGSQSTAALMYGNILLAALGDLRFLPGIDESSLISRIKRLPSEELAFELTDNEGKRNIFVPLFRIEDETYTVYLNLSGKQENVTDFSFAKDGQCAYEET